MPGVAPPHIVLVAFLSCLAALFDFDRPDKKAPFAGQVCPQSEKQGEIYRDAQFAMQLHARNALDASGHRGDG